MTHLTEKEIEQALEQCASEPIHQIGHIQPHGALLVLSLDSQHIVLQASENLRNFINVDAHEFYGQPLASLIGNSAVQQVELLLHVATQQQTASGKLHLMRQETAQTFQIYVYVAEGLLILELTEDVVAHQEGRLAELLLDMQQSLLLADSDTDLENYFAQVAQLVRTLSGYDNVMVYRFNAHWDGEVITQNCIESAPSYLGLYFPASDIPAQARRLYTTNLVRLIADIDAKPVAVLPVVNPLTQQPLDMTYSALRCVSPVHIQYLRNIRAQATMTISLLQNGRLWGLIACHHMSPKRVSISLREAVTFISRMVSAKLTALETQEQHQITANANLLIGEVLKYISSDQQIDVLQRLLPRLMALVDASGIIVVVEGQFYTDGDVPGPNEMNDLLAWMAKQTSSDIFYTDYLSQYFTSAQRYQALAAGLLATQAVGKSKNGIIWLRKDKPQRVNWAGSTEKGYIKTEKGSYQLTPRNSFEIWTESWRGRCTPWSEAEIGVAKMLSLVLPEGLAQKSRQEKAHAEIRIAATAFDSNDGIMITDANGIILRVNSAFTSITGYSSAEVIGRKPNLLRSDRHDDSFYATMWQKLTRVGEWDGEIWNKHKDGNPFLGRISITTVKNHDGSGAHYVATFSDITSARAASEEMERLAFYDPLTRLPNRRLLDEKLNAVFASNARNGHAAALLFIDLDNFKALNDSLGHHAGDILLQQVAQRLGQNVRETDTVARLGGDEFVIILTEITDRTGADVKIQTENVAHKILVALGQPYQLEEHSYHNTPSIGAVILKDHKLGTDELLKQADIAMYKAKRAGRNTVRFFES